jgi:hypothetical protein
MEVPSRDDVLQRMREAVRTRLSQYTDLSYSVLLRETARILLTEKPALIPDGRSPDQAAENYYLNDPQAAAFVEAFWYCVSIGFIIPQPSGNQAGNFNHIRITKLGREWAEGAEPSPEDQEGYLAALRSQVPLLDPVIVQYVEEAVMAYSRRMFFASAVMIGAASEKTIYLLIEALAGSVKDPTHKKTILKSIEARGLPTMFKCLQENLTRAKKHMPWPIHEGADNHLLSLQDAIRVQRNDAVHPQAGKVTPSTVRLTLSAFPGACKKAYDLIQWFKANSF